MLLGGVSHVEKKCDLSSLIVVCSNPAGLDPPGRHEESPPPPREPGGGGGVKRPPPPAEATSTRSSF